MDCCYWLGCNFEVANAEGLLTQLRYADVLVVLNRLQVAYVLVLHARLSDVDCLTASSVV